MGQFILSRFCSEQILGKSQWLTNPETQEFAGFAASYIESS
jgi:hypothetical protein